MYYKKKYQISSPDSGSSRSDHNPLRVPAEYWEKFDQQVMWSIQRRQKKRKQRLVTIAAMAAVFAAGLFVYIALQPAVTPPAPNEITTSDFTESSLTEELLTDDFIGMAVESDTLMLDMESAWQINADEATVSEELAEFLLLDGVTSSEIALTSEL